MFPKSPDWSINLSPVFTFDAGDLSFRVDYSYRGKVYHDVFNSETAAQEGYSLVASRLTFTPACDRWDVSLFGTNLGDERTIEHALFVTGFGPTLAIAGRPREWGGGQRAGSVLRMEPVHIETDACRDISSKEGGSKGDL